MRPKQQDAALLVSLCCCRSHHPNLALPTTQSSQDPPPDRMSPRRHRHRSSYSSPFHLRRRHRRLPFALVSFSDYYPSPLAPNHNPWSLGTTLRCIEALSPLWHSKFAIREQICGSCPRQPRQTNPRFHCLLLSFGWDGPDHLPWFAPPVVGTRTSSRLRARRSPFPEDS